MGELTQRIGQPAVVGEIFAGILLGPTLLGNLSIVKEYMLPSEFGKNYLTIISMIGAMFLLFIAGLETDIKLIKLHSRKAISIATTALLVSFISVFIFSLSIPEYLLIKPDMKYLFAAFLAITISVSAISVIVKVLIDLNLIRRDFGQLFIAIGMIDEVIVWIIVSILIGLVSGLGSSFSGILLSFTKVILFIVLGYVVGRFLIKHFIAFFQSKIKLRDKFLTLVVVVIFVYGAIATALGLEAVLGAFVAGIVLGQVPYLSDETIDKLESITFAIFAPVFFASAGLQVNILEFTDPNIINLTLLLMFIAFTSKTIGGFVGAKFFAKSDTATSLLFGIGLNTRGTIQIILATIGLSIGILSKDIFSIIILISVVASIISPIFIKIIIKKIEPNKDEIQRINQEEIYAKSILSKINRILLPVRVRTDLNVESAKSIEAGILEAIGAKKKISITLLTVTSEKEKLNAQSFLDGIASSFSKSEIIKKVVIAQNPLEKILEESKKDYDLLVIGATEKQNNPEQVFNTFIDNLIRFSPCPSLIVQGHAHFDESKSKKILVPTDGSIASKRAAEVAFALTSNEKDEVHILRVVEEKISLDEMETKDHIMDRQLNYAKEIVNELKIIGESLSVNTHTKVEIGLNPESVIIDVAKKDGFNLVIIGSDVRPGSDKLFLGPRVEKVLSNCECPVIVVNSF
jgi:Kef-type K+ transport system membrane component KefB/nucleotide-binding universal stress UspA family protein